MMWLHSTLTDSYYDGASAKEKNTVAIPPQQQMNLHPVAQKQKRKTYYIPLGTQVTDKLPS